MLISGFVNRKLPLGLRGIVCYQDEPGGDDVYAGTYTEDPVETGGGGTTINTQPSPPAQSESTYLGEPGNPGETVPGSTASSVEMGNAWRNYPDDATSISGLNNQETVANTIAQGDASQMVDAAASSALDLGLDSGSIGTVGLVLAGLGVSALLKQTPVNGGALSDYLQIPDGSGGMGITLPGAQDTGLNQTDSARQQQTQKNTNSWVWIFGLGAAAYFIMRG